MSKRSLSQKELESFMEDLSDFSDGSSDKYEPTEYEGESLFESSDEEMQIEEESESDFEKPSTSKKAQRDEKEDGSSTCDSESSTCDSETESLHNNTPINRVLDWMVPNDSFRPAKTIPPERPCKILVNITKQSTAMEIFHKLFPHSLYLHIVKCTNKRLKMLNRSKGNKKKYVRLTDKGEIQKVLGCMLVMSYNKLPGLKHYWSQSESMGNRTIEKCISRDRYMTIASKLYFAEPNKTEHAKKSYYVDDLISCLKNSFSKCREDSPYQSIDESMTKFKGRSTLKQYMPLKPIKRGIKLWLRCDAASGYTYDLNVYIGKGSEVSDDALTLGEKVVKTLAATIKVPDVVLCFDRFFTSVHLLETITFAALGTCMANRKNVPQLSEKLKRGESIFRSTNTGLLCIKWQDTKEVIVMSNCHKADVTKISKKDKTGQQVEIDCPEAISFYRQKMGGVDRADQFMNLYNHERKSAKWWKKVFYTCLSMCTTNAWILYNDMRRQNEKIPYLTYVVALAEELIAEGKKSTKLPKSNRGTISKKRKLFGSQLHLPVESKTRRRCTRCAQMKVQKRTKTVCEECKVPLCKDCFRLYHIK